MQQLVLLSSFALVSFFSFADLKFRMQTRGDRGDRDRVVYVRGQRIRTEDPATGRVTIRQCDLQRTVLLDSTSKSYRTLPIPEKPASLVPSADSRSGKKVCSGPGRRELEETGEVKQLFGMQAQHIRLFIYSDARNCPDLNVHSALQQQWDGWYIQIPPIPECPARSPVDGTLRPFDQPERFFRSDGSTTPELLPVKVEVKFPSKNSGMQTESTAEVSELSTEPLDAALFDVPVDYQPASIPDCSAGAPIAATLEDGSPIYRMGCGIAPPRLIQQSEPEYSEEGRRKKISGTVELSFIVDKNGDVRDVRVERSLEVSLDQNAIKAVNTWKFRPASKDGQPVAVQIKAEVSFNLNSRVRHR